MNTENIEVTRSYRFDSFADSGELYLAITGDLNWPEERWTDAAEEFLSYVVQRPEVWSITDYEDSY